MATGNIGKLPIDKWIQVTGHSVLIMKSNVLILNPILHLEEIVENTTLIR
jgi:hypothetical protein